LTSRPLIPF
jgi:cellulase